ncbi:MAG: flagellar motor switch protein FliN [Granulosicoccus sp.]|nr:flagellar motor switch protein FliN [Granulosicoccus sp.]
MSEAAESEGSEENNTPDTSESATAAPATNAGVNQNNQDANMIVDPTANLGLIMDIPVTVSMELGRARISIKELLSMNPGAVIELQRLASEPMEILVNGTLVAHGEAVRVGDRYGVRLTNVVSAADRLNQVGS